MFSVKFWVVFGRFPLDAVKVSKYGDPPTVPRAGVPLIKPLAGIKDKPVGSAPMTDNVGEGVPIASTVKLPANPTVKVAELALLNAGGSARFKDIEVEIACSPGKEQSPVPSSMPTTEAESKFST